MNSTMQARVGGDMRYTSEQEATIAPDAIVRGQVARSAPAVDRSRSPLGLCERTE